MNDVKLPPNNNDAEENVIGSLLIDGETIRVVENKVKSADFYFEQNRLIFEACVVLRSRREAINNVTVAQELSRRGDLEKIGGTSRLSFLISVPATSLDIEFYADIVYRLSVSRQLILLGERISGIGYQQEPEINQAVDNVVQSVTDFRRTVTVFNELVTPADAGNVIIDMLDDAKYPERIMSWGFKDLDKLTNGIFPELVYIGARPSVGKSQLMLDMVEDLAYHGKKILFCSAEMMIKAIMQRKIARDLSVDIRTLRQGNYPNELKDRIVQVAGEVSERQVYYLPRGISSQEIYSEASKLKSNNGLDIVFVDYLQLLRDCWQTSRDTKAVQVGRASKVLKTIVDDLGIPVICASQLSREIEHRTDENKKPMLSDLKESGEIEQDADVVFLLWRDKDNPDVEVSNILEVKMAKNRQLGDATAVRLVFLPKEHRYADAQSFATSEEGY
jgi:replicative DNA helicase